MIECLETNKYILVKIILEEIDLRTTPNLYDKVFAEVDKNNKKLVVLDIRKVSYIDSFGISFLASLKKKLEGKNKELSIICDSESILQVFDLLNIGSMFKIYPNLEALNKS